MSYVVRQYDLSQSSVQAIKKIANTSVNKMCTPEAAINGSETG